ncbi:MAG TPA: serine hydrolase [Pyrinomonadaceae bacterium]|nr:serine hydrolase [Pyrinomonadaceae bacterium]
MIRHTPKLFVACLTVFILVTTTQPQTRIKTPASQSLQALVDETVKTTLAKFAEKKLDEKQLSITLINLRDAANPTMASFRGNERIYPASVVKLFFLVAAHRWLEDKKIENTAELRRALKDMIVDSSNEATHYIVDVVTHTTGGYELPAKEMKEWQHRRDAVNRYFSSLGYTNINVNQKTHCEDAYGRERVSREPDGANRNKLTTDATARLMMEVVTLKAVTADRSSQMMELLKRDPTRKTSDTDSQDTGFAGSVLPPGTKYWAKAGWTSTTRHDATYIELPTGEKFVLVVFTEGHANERDIIPAVARSVIEGIKNVK